MRTGMEPGLPDHWQTTGTEVAAHYPCERLATGSVRPLTRAVDIDAPVAVTFRWLCQLRVAPYSYDWLDNLGRRSPRGYTPGLDELSLGQGFIVGTLADFAVDQHITLRAVPAAERVFGLTAMTYAVAAPSPHTSRLVVRLLVQQPNRSWERIRYQVLAWGDLIMMRKQLLTLKDLAEKTADGMEMQAPGSPGQPPATSV